MGTPYDVVVVGGGTAGVVAAVQAGRAGARTLLAEKNAMLGGTMTVGGINWPASFFAWGRQVVAGIGWELVCKTLTESGQAIPDPAGMSRDTGRPVPVGIDIPFFAALCDEAVLDAGVELLFHAMPAAARFADGLWAVDLCTKTGLRQVQAKVLIDATGDANLVALAGLPLNRPDIVQPATLQLHCGGYDPQNLDYAALNDACTRAIADGELKTTDVSWHDCGPEDFLRKHGGNANHFRAPGAETSEGRSILEVEARQSVRRITRFFRRQPGLAGFRVDWICPEAGIRETVTIQGKATVTVQDYESGRCFDDALCHAFYAVDEHLNDGLGINYRLLRPGVVPTIPRGALLPAGSRFLIVAGRCLASDREANSALRVQAPCMAMGQAAGAMAVLAARTGTDPADLPLADIHALLQAHGAIIPGMAGGKS